MTAIASYEDLLVVLRARRLSLGMSLLECDERVGFQGGYTGKLEAYTLDGAGRLKPHTRRVSWPNLINWLEALGLGLEVVERPDANASRKHESLDGQKYRVLEPHFEPWRVRRLRELGKIGAANGASKAGKASAAQLGARGRRARAKRAAMARWAKRKASEDAARASIAASRQA